jgi:acyl-CoA synthetase (AMP-forming)/AMP-acid ligase II
MHQIATRWQTAGDRVCLRLSDAAGNMVLDASGNDLLAMSGRYAAGLAAQGVRRGDRVALVLPTGEAFLGALFGTLWLGAAVAPLAPPTPRLPLDRELDRIGRAVAQADARLIVADAQPPGLALPVVTPAALASPDILADPAAPGPLSVLQFSSGSTGHPKGVALTDAAILANLQAVQALLDCGPDDIGISWLPLHHDMGLFGALLTPQYSGATGILLPPEAFVLDPASWLRAMSEHQGTMSAAPNMAFQICSRLPAHRLTGMDLSPWRAAMTGAEPVRGTSMRAFAATMAPYGFRAETLMPTYGLAEATLVLTSRPQMSPLQTDCIRQDVYRTKGLAEPAGPETPPDQVLELTSVGTPIAGTTISIRDHEGVSVPERHVGEIWAQTGSMMTGYINDAEASAAVLTEDGWLRTGDLGYFADGELYISGRAKDLIIRTGTKYHPEDLEPLVDAHPAVRAGGTAIVVADGGQPGRERVLLLAEARSGSTMTPAALRQELKQQLHTASGLRVDEVVLLQPQQLPKTTSGKIRRHEACRRYLAGELVTVDG